jgi:hypothetical protein
MCRHLVRPSVSVINNTVIGKMLRPLARYFSFGTMFFALAIIFIWQHLEGRARLAGDPPPQAWREQAAAEDALSVAGHDIVYWADPEARYSVSGSKRGKKPVAIVIHYTAPKPVLRLIAYGQRPDFSRGGHAFGYHFYIGRRGGIAQGAPLSKRTNHIKSARRSQRRQLARHLWSGNTIGVSLVGGCDPLLRPNWRRWHMCGDEFVTRRQLTAGLAVIRALQEKFDIPCDQVFGHGELQHDRAAFEGATLTALARDACAAPGAGDGGHS